MSFADAMVRFAAMTAENSSPLISRWLQLHCIVVVCFAGRTLSERLNCRSAIVVANWVRSLSSPDGAIGLGKLPKRPLGCRANAMITDGRAEWQWWRGTRSVRAYLS